MYDLTIEEEKRISRAKGVVEYDILAVIELEAVNRVINEIERTKVKNKSKEVQDERK